MDSSDRSNLQALIEAEDWAGARSALEKLASVPEDVDWLGFHAEVESGSGNLEAAAALYEKILKLNPEHRAALYNSSVTYSDLDRHDEAMAALEALIQVEGETCGVLNDLAYEYLEAGLPVPALLAAGRAEALAADEDQRCLARLNAATSLANMGRRTDARTRLDLMLGACTGACGEREAAEELRASLDPRKRRRATRPT